MTETTAADYMKPSAQQLAPDGDLVAAMRKATRREHTIANVLILAKLAVALTDRQLYAKVCVACFM